MPTEPISPKSVLLGQMPPPFERLYHKLQGLGKVPMVLRLPNGGVVLEIQYLTALHEASEADKSAGILPFAITTDGHELLLNFTSSRLEVLQREFGEIESLDICVAELLKAEVHPI